MKIWKYIFGILSLLLILAWLIVWSLPDNNLHIIACNVGQGDGILITYKSYQILTDGGPSSGGVLKCLNSHMPFWDREIELVILTHPQIDHFGGLTSVFKNFKVDNFLANPLDSSSEEYGLLKKMVGSRGTKVINPREGMGIGLGLIHLDIFNPTNALYEDEMTNPINSGESSDLVKFTTRRDLNSFSILYRLTFGKFRAIMSGDIDPKQLSNLIQKYNDFSAEYIKVPHHGSDNGLSYEFLQSVMPKVAIISVGKNNKYGHPNRGLVEMLTKQNISIYRTDLNGEVEIVSDGIRWWRSLGLQH